MEEQSPTRRVLVAVVEGRRQKGRPKLRWEDGVTEDARKLGERTWRNAARNRDSWQKLLKKALAQKGLLCCANNDDDDDDDVFKVCFQTEGQGLWLSFHQTFYHRNLHFD